MSLIKRPSAAVLLSLLVVVGFGCTIAGLYLLLGLAVALIVGGVAAVVLGLLADS